MEKTAQSVPFHAEAPDTRLVKKAKKRFGNMKWLLPLGQLHGVKGVHFGRHISQSVEDLTAPVKLSVRNKERAVVMSVKRYEEILAIMESYSELVDMAKEADIAKASDSYDALYARITASRKGTDSLFSASVDDINASYKPGMTESL